MPAMNGLTTKKNEKGIFMKTLRRKSFILPLVIAFMLTLLIGCASGDNSGSVAPTQPEAGNEGASETPAETNNTGWKSDVVLGAGALGGNYYNIGAALGDMLSQRVDQVERVTVTSGSNISFIPMLNDGKVDMLFSNPDTFYFAWSEEEGLGFQAGQRMEKLRMMSAFFVNIMDIVVLKNSPIHSLKDIGNGKVAVLDVSLKEPMEILLRAHGVEDPNVVAIADWNQMGQALRDGSLKAIQAISAQPIPAVVDLSKSVDVRILPLEEAAIDEFLDNPTTRFFQKVTQPAGTYDWQEEDILTVGRGSTLGVTSDLSDEQVYEMTKAIYEHVDDLTKVVPVAEAFTLDMMQEYLDAGVIQIPFHPGARKYFEEQGLHIPDSVPLE